MKRAIGALLVGGLVLVAAPVGAREDTRKIHGTFTLTDNVLWDEPSICWGTDGYDDIKAGLGVTVRNQKGKILATSRLEQGVYQSGSRHCVFTFKIGRVPSARFYSIEVGSRGELTYSVKEMNKMRWQVAFTLG